MQKIFLQYIENDKLKLKQSIRDISQKQTPKEIYAYLNTLVYDMQKEIRNNIDAYVFDFFSDFSQLDPFSWEYAQQYMQDILRVIPEDMHSYLPAMNKKNTLTILNRKWEPIWTHIMTNLRDSSPEKILAAFSENFDDLQKEIQKIVDQEYKDSLQRDNTVIQIT